MACFICKKFMINFLSYGSRNDILRNGYRPPDMMNDLDRLCKSCLMKLKENEPQGEVKEKAVSMAWQIFTTIWIPGYAALKIEKWRKMFLISIPRSILSIYLFLLAIGNESPLLFMIALLWYFANPIDLYFIYKWTSEWNKDKI